MTTFITIKLRNEMGSDEAFRVNRPFIDSSKPLILHDHEFYECFWIETGTCFHFINGREEVLNAMDLVFIRPADRHAFQNKGSSPCLMINIAFSAETARHLHTRYHDELDEQFFWSSKKMPLAFSLDPDQVSDLKKLERNLDRGSRSLVRIETFLLELMTNVLAVSDEVPSETPHWLAAACEQVHDLEHLRRGVPALVDLTGKSHEHVSRTFRKIFGQSPSAYINRLRMEFAARNLEESNASIIDIALDCGTEDLSHFYKLFRSVYGTTPRKYRKRTQLNLVHPTAQPS